MVSLPEQAKEYKKYYVHNPSFFVEDYKVDVTSLVDGAAINIRELVPDDDRQYHGLLSDLEMTYLQKCGIVAVKGISSDDFRKVIIAKRKAWDFDSDIPFHLTTADLPDGTEGFFCISMNHRRRMAVRSIALHEAGERKLDPTVYWSLKWFNCQIICVPGSNMQIIENICHYAGGVDQKAKNVYIEDRDVTRIVQAIESGKRYHALNLESPDPTRGGIKDWLAANCPLINVDSTALAHFQQLVNLPAHIQQTIQDIYTTADEAIYKIKEQQKASIQYAKEHKLKKPTFPSIKRTAGVPSKGLPQFLRTIVPLFSLPHQVLTEFLTDLLEERKTIGELLYLKKTYTSERLIIQVTLVHINNIKGTFSPSHKEHYSWLDTPGDDGSVPYLTSWAKARRRYPQFDEINWVDKWRNWAHGTDARKVSTRAEQVLANVFVPVTLYSSDVPNACYDSS